MSPALVLRPWRVPARWRQAEATMDGRPGGDHSSTRVALWAAVGGLATALLTAFLNRTLLFDEEAGEATTLGAIGFVAVLAAPFVLALLASFLPDTEQRRSVWLASAALALVIAGLSIFSVGMLFLIVAAALGWAWWATRSPAGLIRDRISCRHPLDCALARKLAPAPLVEDRLPTMRC
ncbi:MAG: hypothetical protein C4346_19870, partial [Chloroflexota bacterium]